MCPGSVSLAAALERRVGNLRELLDEALNMLEEEPATAGSVVAQGVIERGRIALGTRSLNYANRNRAYNDRKTER